MGGARPESCLFFFPNIKENLSQKPPTGVSSCLIGQKCTTCFCSNQSLARGLSPPDWLGPIRTQALELRRPKTPGSGEVGRHLSHIRAAQRGEGRGGRRGGDQRDLLQSLPAFLDFIEDRK